MNALNPVLRFIYLLLRLLVWFGMNVFYRRRYILGRENLNFKGPALIVVNHPSTLMDVLNTCLHIRQESFFLANYGLFKHPVSNWILSRLFCIPVKRREDVPEGADRNNDHVFEKSFEHLDRKGLLFIAAEGVSWMERWVRPFKTGAARIAFGAEKRHNWELGVKILPVGLSYSAPNLFRSEVWVQYGKPIDVQSWKEAETLNHETAVAGFTQSIQEQVRSMVLDTRDLESQAFIENLECLKSSDFPLAPRDRFVYRKNLIDKNLDNLALKAAIDEYWSALSAADVTEDGLKSYPVADRRLDYILLVAGFPFFLAGYIFWFLPCYLPWLLAKKMNLYIGYVSNIKLLAGFITFPFMLWGAFQISRSAGCASMQAWGVLFLALLLGFIAEGYLNVYTRLHQWLAVRSLQKRNVSAYTTLLRLRQHALEQVIL